MDIDYNKLADALMDNEKFAARLAARVAAVDGVRTGDFKQKLDMAVADLWAKRKQEIRDELDAWFHGHIKRQIEDRKKTLILRLEEETKNFIDTKLDVAFRDAGRGVIERLIRDKFADVSLSFTISDLFRDTRDY